MVIDAHVFYWTRDGMQARQPVPHAVGYIQRGEVERLLEEAHARGQRLGLDDGLARAIKEVKRK